MVKKENYFKVGDIIKGKEGNGYSITNESMEMAEVISVDKKRMSMSIKMLEAKKDIIFTVDNTLEKFDTYYPFKRGDFITGTEESRFKYSITTNRMKKGVVIETDGETMKVKILEHSDSTNNNTYHCVLNDATLFRHCSDIVKDVKLELPTLELTYQSPIYNMGYTLPPITYTTDCEKNTTVTYKDYKSESNCNLGVDEFNGEYGLGVALERLGKMLQEKNPVKSKGNGKTYVKIVQLLPVDEESGLNEGDVVEALYFGEDEACLVPCAHSTYLSFSNEINNKAKEFDFPVQLITPSQYEKCEPPEQEWLKSDIKTDYVRIIKSGTSQREVGVKEGDIVKVLQDNDWCLYVESKEKNRVFGSSGNIHTDYFTFLGTSQEWEYVKRK